jgi:hypothetical protein
MGDAPAAPLQGVRDSMRLVPHRLDGQDPAPRSRADAKRATSFPPHRQRQYPLSGPRSASPSLGAYPYELGPAVHKTAGSGFEWRAPARSAKARGAFATRVRDRYGTLFPVRRLLEAHRLHRASPLSPRCSSISACPPAHHPQHRRGPSIDSQWPDHQTDTHPIRFSLRPRRTTGKHSTSGP